jgi:hypothetical protein
MSPPIPDLGSPDIQKYKDGQLKWIIENGIRMTGMPGWRGLLQDNDMWQLVVYIRHLPARGSLGVPPIFLKEGEKRTERKDGRQGNSREAGKPSI